MRDEQHAAFSAYLRDLADVMGLRDWEIDLAREDASGPDTGASCSTTYGRKVATIHFGADFFYESPETQRYYCVHELLHCHFRAIVEARDGLEDLLGTPANLVFVDRMRSAEEWAVDAIAGAIAPFLPLPPSGEGGE